MAMGYIYMAGVTQRGFCRRVAQVKTMSIRSVLKQHIQSPTRVTPRSQSLIDLIITSIDDNKTIDSGVVEMGIRDHSLVYLCRKVSIPKEMPKIIFSIGSLKILMLINSRKI